MVLIKSFFATVTWSFALYSILLALNWLGVIVTSTLAFTSAGFVVLFIVFLLENLDLRY